MPTGGAPPALNRKRRAPSAAGARLAPRRRPQRAPAPARVLEGALARCVRVRESDSVGSRAGARRRPGAARPRGVAFVGEAAAPSAAGEADAGEAEAATASDAASSAASACCSSAASADSRRCAAPWAAAAARNSASTSVSGATAPFWKVALPDSHFTRPKIKKVRRRRSRRYGLRGAPSAGKGHAFFHTHRRPAKSPSTRARPHQARPRRRQRRLQRSGPPPARGRRPPF